MLHRAYSLLAIKSVDEDARILTGIATTPTPDRMGDVVEPGGAEFKLPFPLLWQHDSAQPIGEVFAAKVTADGIEIKARIAKVDEPGTLKDRLDEAWQSIKHGLVRGLSIGFSSLEYSRLESGGLRFLKWLWLELSAVTIPANAEATIQTIKSCDLGRAASGTPADRTHTPGVTGHRVVKAQSDPKMKTITDQIKSFEATRQAKAARMAEIMDKSAAESVTLDAEQTEEYDGLKAEVKAIDEHLVRLHEHEALNKAAAKPVNGDTQEKASASRGGETVIRVTDNLPPGVRFARAAMCIAAARGSRSDAIEIAKTAYADEPRLQEFIKAAVGAATTGNTQGPLLQYTDYLGDFVDYQRPGSILGKFGQGGIPALRPIPFNSRVSTQTAGGSAGWVGQGLPAALTKGTFGTITIDFMKVATIAVLTKEEVRFANPSAEMKVRDDLAAAINARIDQDFVDPANAGTANVKPASITNGVAATAVSGTDADAVRVDFKNLMSAFITANITANGFRPVLIMPVQIALNLSLMLNTLGQREFPDISMNGGSLFGVPVIVSEYLTSLGSPSTGMVVMVNSSDVYLADDGNVSVEASGEASLEMLDSGLSQDGTAGTGASLVSLWQNGLLGLKAEREIAWKKRRSQAAQYLSPVAYAPA